MPLKNLLSERKNEILERWFELIMGTYSLGATGGRKEEKDVLSNPIEHITSKEIGVIYEELLSPNMNLDKLMESLDNIIRVRAIQDFSPSEAISFVFFLKKAVREELKKEMGDHKILREILNFETAIDKLASMAFDIYVKCKQDIYELRVNEVRTHRDRVIKVLDDVNVAYDELEKKYEELKKARKT
ncbi:MAG: RsbRD N-terminal domain-containing protein [Methanobacteriota archaeon]